MGIDLYIAVKLVKHGEVIETAKACRGDSDDAAGRGWEAALGGGWQLNPSYAATWFWQLSSGNYPGQALNELPIPTSFARTDFNKIPRLSKLRYGSSERQQTIVYKEK